MEKRRELFVVLSLASILVLSGFSFNQDAYAGAQSLGDFVCWISVQPAALNQFQTQPHTIQDQFDTIVHDLWDQSEYCTAAEKHINSQGPYTPPTLIQHYQSWFYSGPLQNPNPAAVGQMVSISVPQFSQTFEATIDTLDEFMVPADKITEQQGPVFSVNKNHHWNCYEMSGAELVPPDVGGQLDLSTQHGDLINVSVLEPFLLCAPAIKDEFQTNQGLEGEHMVCYDILVGSDQTSDLPFSLLDQFTQTFAPFQIDFGSQEFLGGIEKLCVPALKSVIPPPAVGGSDVPINTSALLLAGVESVSMWMIPVVIAGVGIGIFVIKRRQ